jgi:muramoyltetrapeptide carboxypeptidase
MTDMKDTAVPFGMSYQDVILSHFQFRKIPIAFNFPAGHISDNQALIIGSEVAFNVTSKGAELNFL